jgi:hypothetical protein
VLIRDTADAGEDWLAALSVMEPLDLEDAPVVVIIDALPPDVWLETMPALEPYLKDAVETWYRLDTKPETCAAMNALFGFGPESDPIDAFAVLGIAYTRIEGNESLALTEQMLPLRHGSTAVIRLGLFDRSVHEGSMRLCDFPDLLQSVLGNSLPGLIDLCAQEGRRLVLTTDHGLSYTKRRISHGKGGVYERAIVRVVWGA